MPLPALPEPEHHAAAGAAGVEDALQEAENHVDGDGEGDDVGGPLHGAQVDMVLGHGLGP